MSLLICLIFFLILLVVLERISSIKIIIRLVLSVAILYGYIKLIADGKSIIKCSILLVGILSFINIFIKNGIHKKSFSELISVLITTFLTSGIIWVICKTNNIKMFQDEIMSLNGIKNSENAVFSISAIILLGFYMDIISGLIFCLDEQKDKTIDIAWKDQFKQGIEIGKKIIGEKINIVLLILLSVSLFPICMNINKDMNIIQICNEVDIFVYVLIAIIANIGLVLSVYITSACFASINRKKTIYKTVSENKIDGKRSLKL